MKCLIPIFPLIMSGVLVAQQQAPPSLPPVPSQFATARTIFLAPAGSASSGTAGAEVTTYLYRSFTQAIRSLNKYQIKAAPAEAELSMRMSLGSTFSEVTSGSNFIYFYYKLEVYDTHTGMLLWTLEEPVERANRKATLFKNFDASALKLAADLKALSEGNLPDVLNLSITPAKK